MPGDLLDLCPIHLGGGGGGGGGGGFMAITAREYNTSC